ncbi:MAG: hypothetical protein ACFFCS_27615 [Candidatus Hodarchaeota archaeon]
MELDENLFRSVWDNLPSLTPEMIITAVLFAASGMLLLTTRKKRVSALSYFSGFYFFLGIQNLMTNLHSILYLTPFFDYWLLTSFSAVPATCSFIFLSLFVDKTRGEVVSWWRMVVVTAFGAICIGVELVANPAIINLRTGGTFTWEEYDTLLEGAGQDNPYNLPLLVPWFFLRGISGFFPIGLLMMLVIPMLREIPTLRGGERVSVILLFIYVFLIMPLLSGVEPFLRLCFGINLGENWMIFVMLGTFVAFPTGLFIFLFHPEILIIIKVRARRLIIIHDPSGVSLFHYDFMPAGRWSGDSGAEQINEELLAGLMKGVMMMSEVVLQAGVLKEIKVAGGVLLFAHEPQFTVGFLCERSVPLLEEGLLKFSRGFAEYFKENLDNYSGDITPFKRASRLLPEYFSMVARDVG